MKDSRVVVSQDGLSQWHCQVVADSPDSDLIMVTTGPDLDPDNIKAWIMEPSEQDPADKTIKPNPMNTRKDKDRGRPVHKERATYKTLRRGDSVILVAKNHGKLRGAFHYVIKLAND